MMNLKKILIINFIFLIFVSIPAMAGGPIFVSSSGVVATWNNLTDIRLDTEIGACANLSYTEMADLIEESVIYWTDIDEIYLSFDINPGMISTDINIDNYTNYYVTSSTSTGFDDNYNAVIYDDTGEITQALFEDTLGADAYAQVLGFAGPDRYNDDQDTMLDGQLFLNCRCYASNVALYGPCIDDEGDPVVFTAADRLFVMTHEIGHMLGLTHSAVGEEMTETTCDVTDADAGGGGGDCDDVALMYSISIDPADQITPMRDDEVAILNLYGVNGWDSDLCTVTGDLVDVRGYDLRCADVQAVASDSENTIAAVSGALSPQSDTSGDSYTDDEDECLSDCGQFVIHGLEPSRTYDITVKPINTDFVSGSTILPCGSYQLEGVIEEVIDTSFSCLAGETKSLNNGNGEVETISCSGLIEDADSDLDGVDDCTDRGGVIMVDASGVRTDLDGDGDDDCCLSQCGGTGACSSSGGTGGSDDNGGGSGGGSSTLASSGCSLNVR